MAKRSKTKIDRDHEMHLALIKAFAADPELKYFVGFAMGSGVTWLGAMLSQYGLDMNQTSNTDTQDPDAAAKNELIEKLKGIPYGYLAMGGGLLGVSLFGLQQQQSKLSEMSFGPDGGLQGNIGNILMMGGMGFSSTCAMILILRSIFSGTDLGELLSGVGEIIPL